MNLLFEFRCKGTTFFSNTQTQISQISTIFAELSKKGNYSATEMPNTGHRGQMSAEPMSELNSDVMDEEKGDVWQTPATTKKKKPACSKRRAGWQECSL